MGINQLRQITRKRLIFAEWFTLIFGFSSTLLSLFLILFRINLQAPPIFRNPFWSLVDLVASTYIFLTLKNFLNAKFDFHDANRVINWIIGISIGSRIVTHIYDSFFPNLGLFAEVIYAELLFIPIGILFILLGKRLLRLRDRMDILLKSLSYLFVASGFCFFVFFAIPFGIGVLLVSDIILGILFLRSGKKWILEYGYPQ